MSKQTFMTDVSRRGVLVAIAGVFGNLLLRGQEPSGRYGYGPPDAFLASSPYPYYGSEGQWDRRAYEPAQLKSVYARRGQKVVLDLVEGRRDEALSFATTLVRADPSDPEPRFVLALAEVASGHLDSAVEAAEEAIRLGLPFERLLAGPQEFTAPIVQVLSSKRQPDAKRHRLVHGPMVGAVSDSSARFWIRASGGEEVYAVLSPDHALSSPVRSSVERVRESSSNVAVVKAMRLQPNVRYHYNVMVDGRPEFVSPYPSFRTYPRKGEKGEFSVGFGGCASYNPDYERMWDTIDRRDPLAFLLMGDNVYIDLPTVPHAVHRYAYYCRQSRPEFRRLVGKRSIYATWDDHDGPIDDVWLGPHRDRPEWKMPQFRFFQENWNNPGHGTGAWPGGWFSFAIGDVDFFMLDTRMYRTNPYDVSSRTMLGPIQKPWLLESLKKSDATFKVIVSSVSWSDGAKPGAVDTFSGFPEEREEVYDFLAKHSVGGVVLLSGDRHRSDAWLNVRSSGYPVYEFHSCRLTNPDSTITPLMPGALFGYNAKPAYGHLTFNTLSADPSVTFRIVNIDDEVVNSLTVRLSAIS